MSRSRRPRKCSDCGKTIDGSLRCSRCAHRHRLGDLLRTNLGVEQRRIISLVLECGTYEAAAQREGISRQRIEQIIHADRLLHRQRARYHQHRESGICVRCSRPAVRKRLHCQACLAEKKRRYRAEKKRRKGDLFYSVEQRCPVCLNA